jgi:YegS/Rv2252/BmrU family lipid kinase
VRIGVVGNPKAGRGRTDWDDIVGRLGGAQLWLTEGRGHGTELARQARDLDIVVAAGGDGTVNEVVNGLLDGGTSAAALGIVPLGSGCDYAKTFDIPHDIAAACERITAAKPALSVDAGEIRCRRGENESVRYFANIAEVGIGPEVVARASRLPRALGPAMYFAAFCLTLPRYERRTAEITIDGERYDGPLTNLVVAIGQVFGGGMRVAPAADPCDGMFDVQVQFGSKRDYVAGIAKVYRGTHLPHPRIREARGERIAISTTPPGLIEADGEVVGTTPATFRALPGALRLKA